MQSQVLAGQIPANSAVPLSFTPQLDAPLTERQFGLDAVMSGQLEETCKVTKAGSTNSVMKKLFLALFVMTLARPVAAQTKTLLNLDRTGLAIQGYDPVAFFTDGKPVKGNPEFPARYNGALYYFASKEHRDLFKAGPAKYEPSFGGFCAYGVSRNKLVEIEVDAFQIVDGRLLLQYSKGVRDDFNKDTKGNLSKANTNWPALVEKKGK
jgi:YHS domain-containing protein